MRNQNQENQDGRIHDESIPYIFPPKEILSNLSLTLYTIITIFSKANFYCILFNIHSKSVCVITSTFWEYIIQPLSSLPKGVFSFLVHIAKVSDLLGH